MTHESETFLAKIMKGWRICIYEPVRENLGFEIGDMLRVTVHLEKRSDEIKPKQVVDVDQDDIFEEEKPVELVEPEIEGPDMEEPPWEPGDLEPEEEAKKDGGFFMPWGEEEAEPPEEEVDPEPEEIPDQQIVDLPPTQEVTTVSGAEEIVVFDVFVPGDEEVIMELCPKGLGKPLQDLNVCVLLRCAHFEKNRGKDPECTYEWTWLEEDVDAPAQGEGDGFCPHHLEKPLEDQEVCLEWNCVHYRRKYGPNPTRCVWPGWPKEAEGLNQTPNQKVDLNEL